MSAISLDGLTLSYQDQRSRVRVLDDVNLTVEPGEVHAIVGPSGSGKSTLLAVAGLLQRPDEGRVIICGTDATGLPEGQRTRIRADSIGFVFQAANLLPHLTLVQNVMIPLLARGFRASEVDALALLDSVGLGSLRDRLPSEVSGGQAQRVSLCRALIRQPPVLIADEPTANLDAKAAAEVRKLIIDIAHERGISVLLATHDLLTSASADVVSTLAEGALMPARLTAQGEGR